MTRCKEGSSSCQHVLKRIDRSYDGAIHLVGRSSRGKPKRLEKRGFKGPMSALGKATEMTRDYSHFYGMMRYGIYLSWCGICLYNQFEVRVGDRLAVALLEE